MCFCPNSKNKSTRLRYSSGRTHSASKLLFDLSFNSKLTKVSLQKSWNHCLQGSSLSSPTRLRHLLSTRMFYLLNLIFFIGLNAPKFNIGASVQCPSRRLHLYPTWLWKHLALRLSVTLKGSIFDSKMLYLGRALVTFQILLMTASSKEPFN